MSKKIVEYILTSRSDTLKLKEHVNYLISEGWQPLGGHKLFKDVGTKTEDGKDVFNEDGTPATGAFAQAMVKYEEKSTVGPISLLLFFMMSVVFMVHDLHHLNNNLEKVASYVERSAAK